MVGVVFAGEVVERQTYLNGMVYLLIEASAEDGGTAQLAVTLPREQGEPVEEGDLALSAPEATWFGTVHGGEHHERWDETLDAPYTEISLRVERVENQETTVPWQSVAVVARVRGDLAEIEIAGVTP
jgi:hypothetical protein